MAHSLEANPSQYATTADAYEEVRRIFLLHDRRGDGKIGIAQLGDCLRVVGINPSEATVRQHQQQLQAGTIGRISFDEFMSIYEMITQELQNYPYNKEQEAEQFITTLRLFDEQGNGHMPAGRLRHILTQCGDCLSPSEVNDLLKNLVNEQGLVNYVEFVHAIMSG